MLVFSNKPQFYESLHLKPPLAFRNFNQLQQQNKRLSFDKLY